MRNRDEQPAEAVTQSVTAETSPYGPEDAPATEPATLQPGHTLDRYVILRRAGSGGSAVVYAAYDPELDRKVALKLLRGHRLPSDAVRRARLLREAKALARVNHPNVVVVHEVSAVGDQLFLVQELVQGTTLREWLAVENRSPRAIVQAFVEAGRGLAAAHAAGLVHRDFKPDNVLVGDDGRVRVGDFGLARSLDAADDGDLPADASPAGPAVATTLTQSGLLVGTPGYMAPEQLRGTRPDERADQFAYCVSLWEALAGERPFSGDEVDESLAEIAAGRLRGARGLPGRIRRALERGLSADPAARWPSLDALLVDLARDPAARWRRASIAAAAVAAIGGAVAFGALRSERRESPCGGAEQALAGVWDDARRDAVRRAFRASTKRYAADALANVERALDGYAASWVDMHESACVATRVRGDQSDEILDLRMICLAARLDEMGSLVDVLERADESAIASSSRAARGLTPIAACADLEALTAPVPPPVDPEARARVAAIRRLLAEARALEWIGRSNDAIAVALPTLAAARALGHRPLVAEALYRAGRVQYKRSEADRAEPLLEEALWTASASGHLEIVARSSADLVSTLGVQQTRYADAARWGRAGLAAVDRLREDGELRAELENSLGGLARRQGRGDEALAHHQRALALRRRAFGPDDPRVAASLGNLSNVHGQDGRLVEALALLKDALAIFEKAYGPSHPDVGAGRLNAAVTLWELGRADEAIVEQTRAIEIFTEAGADPLDLAVGTSNLGTMLLARGDTDGALARFEQARELFETSGTVSPDAALVFEGLADLYRTRGDVDRALAYARRALALREQLHGREHPEVATSLEVLAMAELARGDIAAAELHLTRAGALVAKHLGEDHFAMGRVLMSSGDVRRRAGDPRGALRFYERAREILTKSESGLAHEVGGKIGSSYLALGDPERAVREIEAALAALEPGRVSPALVDELRADLVRARAALARRR